MPQPAAAVAAAAQPPQQAAAAPAATQAAAGVAAPVADGSAAGRTLLAPTAGEIAELIDGPADVEDDEELDRDLYDDLSD